MSSSPEADRLFQPIFDRLRCGLMASVMQIEEFRAAVEPLIAEGRETPAPGARDEENTDG